MAKIWTLAVMTFYEGMRERVFLGVLVFILFLLLISGILAQLSIGNTLKVTQDIGLGGLNILGLFIALFLSTQLMAKDLDKKTVYLVLCRPVSRGQYIFGKFVGLAFLNALAVVAGFVLFLLALFFFSATSDLINPPIIAWGKHIVAFVFLLLQMFLVTAIAAFFSSFASNGLISFFFTLIVYFVGCNLNNVKLILESKIGENINPSLKGIFSFAYWILPNISLLDLKSWAVHDMTLSVAELGLRFAYGTFFIAALLFLAAAIFSRRELS